MTQTVSSNCALIFLLIGQTIELSFNVVIGSIENRFLNYIQRYEIIRVSKHDCACLRIFRIINELLNKSIPSREDVVSESSLEFLNK